VHGLKRTDSLFAAEADAATAPPWQGEAFTDSQGTRWLRLEPDRLLADPVFLDASLPLAD